MTDRIEMAALKKGAERTTTVDVPDLGGSVVLRSITRQELMDIRTEIGLGVEGFTSPEQGARMDILILLAAWLEPAEIHDEDDPEALLAGQPAGLVNDLARAALKVSGLSAEDRFLD